MNKITGTDLMKHGWQPGPALGLALKEAKKLVEDGKMSVQEALTQIGPPPAGPQPLLPRETPVALEEAITAPDDAEGQQNLRNVREHMNQLLRVPVVTGAAIMPDCCPAGAEPITVGGAIGVENAIVPAAHSADICCSMMGSFWLWPKEETIDTLLPKLRGVGRFGQGGRREGEWVPSPINAIFPSQNKFLHGLERYGRQHLADCGDGNHFLYIGKTKVTEDLALAWCPEGPHQETLLKYAKEERELLTLVSHFGSRGLGAQLYKRGKVCAEQWMDKLLAQTPKGTEWIPYDTEDGQAYWEALCFINNWTQHNHYAIHNMFEDEIRTANYGDLEPGWNKVHRQFNAHNFVWKRGKTFQHGKGATPSWHEEGSHGVLKPTLGLIPLNMANPILITESANNPQYLSFAPHGAGRNRSRTATMRQFQDTDGKINLKALNEAVAECTKGIRVEWFSGKMDPAETPLGYKDAATIEAEIRQFNLARIVGKVEPLGCIMAGEQPEPIWKQKRREKRTAK